MAALLKDAINPNLVQTGEGNPIFVHGGPFANIAHGTSSVIAAELALDLADYVVTECGFGSDLGMVKFFDIVVRTSPLPPPDACVLVATVRSLKYHGGVKRDDLENPDINALEKGFVNLQKHIENLRFFGVPFVVALNRFSSDRDEEVEKVMDLCRKDGARVALSEVYTKGSEGGVALAEEIIEAIEKDEHNFQYLYPLDMPLIEKIEVLATKMFGAASVAMEGKIRRRIRRIERIGFQNLPVCVAKTQYSLSDDDQLLGRPEDFTMIVTDASLSSGAGFVVVHCGDIMTMPGLPKIPASEKIDVNPDGEITGLA
jgi:formate--tetrahydrofolate ligase